MGSFFGGGFNVNEPADSDAVKRGASWIRDLKSRIYEFIDVFWNPTTAAWKEGVVPSDALASLSPDPTGEYSQITVNNKGQVTGGVKIGGGGSVLNTQSNIYAAIFDGTTSRYFDHSGSVPVKKTTAAVPVGSQATFSWKVPATVSSVKVTIIGGGGGGQNTYAGSASIRASFIVPVVAGATLPIYVGLGGADGGAGDGTVGGNSEFGTPASDVYCLVPGGNPATTLAHGTAPTEASITTKSGNVLLDAREGADGSATSGGPPAGDAFDSNAAGKGGDIAGSGGNAGQIIIEYVA